jgi:hypothetical protein
MNCIVCLIEGKKPSYQDVAVIAGYSLCDLHLKEWAKSQYSTVAEWVVDRTSTAKIEPTTAAQGPMTAGDYATALPTKEELEKMVEILSSEEEEPPVRKTKKRGRSKKGRR